MSRRDRRVVRDVRAARERRALPDLPADAGRILVDALLGTDHEQQDPDTAHLFGRLSWLRAMLTVCEEHREAIEGDDPEAHGQMMGEVRFLLDDAEAAMRRFGYHPERPGRAPSEC